MYTVKLTFNYDWPLFRQTPGFAGEWGNYRFVIDDSVSECDMWVVYSDYKLSASSCRCAPENTVFIPAEGSSTSPVFSREFLNQFGHIVTVQREIKHRSVHHYHNGNPWFVGKSLDELLAISLPKKCKDISLITSNKAFTPGHRRRLRFASAVKAHFGERLDLFGRGYKDFDDKWTVLADYRYSIAIENDFAEDWVTEKFFDCLLAFTHPLYYGCPNLEKYVSPLCYTRIYLDNLESAIGTIEKSIHDQVFERSLPAIAAERRKFLEHEHLFPLMARFGERLDFNAPKQQITLKPNYPGVARKILVKLRRRLLKFLRSNPS
jgi:hypothetical protein